MDRGHSGAFIALQIAQQDASPLSGLVRSRQNRSPAGIGGHLDPADLHPDPKLASAADRDLLAVGLVDRGSGYLAQDGRHCFVSGGDLAVYDTSRPFPWAMSGDWRLRVYAWPRESIAVSSAELQQLTATPVRTSAGVGFFLSPMLDRLTQSAAGMSGEGAVRLACEVAELTVPASTRFPGSTEPDHQRDRVQVRVLDTRLLQPGVHRAIRVSPRRYRLENGWTRPD
ncbi:transcriptional regulator [Rhodococcus sp. JVH1]|uniref:transcriptional regulator n=1 Tax=Rhodococcus sp. JVH1 TaxID=745408 RepID=UPI0002E19312|nr:transcriptional regulator [Rhodococcus sp. JVH1]